MADKTEEKKNEDEEPSEQSDRAQIEEGVVWALGALGRIEARTSKLSTKLYQRLLEHLLSSDENARYQRIAKRRNPWDSD